MKNNKPIFSVKNVVMDFNAGNNFLLGKKKKIRALNDISFDLFPGESLAIVGESGCGKSTICRIAMKFYEPTAGTMTFADKDIHKLKGKALKEYRQKAQMIFQDPFSSLNPLHNIYYHLERPMKLYHNYNAKERKAKMDEYLEMVGLTPASEQGAKYPHQLSGGQKQRAYLARILAVGSDVIFADEPTSMLDVSIRLGVLNLMNQMKKELNKSFIYITHDIATARYFADRIIVLYSGHMVEYGEVNEVILNPKHPYTKLLIAAAPDPEREGVVELPVIRNDEGEVSSWSPDSKGCPFYKRCPVSTKECASEFPPEKQVGANQFVRCIHEK
ncbi:MAG: ABC transporter ATP-binding protein [Erysipelotrichaceae bacterium]